MVRGNFMGITQRQIAVAALELAEEHGAEALTMKSLATALDRQPSSLYNHITGRDDLIERMREVIVDDIDTSSFASKPWDAALIDWATSYLAAFATRQNSIKLLAATPISDPSTLRMYDTVIVALCAGGWPGSEAVSVMRTVEAHVLGSALDTIAPSSLISTDVLPAELVTLRQALAPAHDAQTSASAAFELGIHALVFGLRDVLGQRGAAER